MEVEFDAKMTRGVLQDYMLHNGYNKAIWIGITIAGALLFASFFFTGRIGTAFIGVAVMLYMPVYSFFRAGKVAKKERFQDRSFFIINEDGITKVDGSNTKRIEWDEVSKATATRRCIMVYTTDEKTCVLPRVDMGDKAPAVIEIIATHISPEKNKIHW